MNIADFITMPSFVFFHVLLKNNFVSIILKKKQAFTLSRATPYTFTIIKCFCIYRKYTLVRIANIKARFIAKSKKILKSMIDIVLFDTMRPMLFTSLTKEQTAHKNMTYVTRARLCDSCTLLLSFSFWKETDMSTNTKKSVYDSISMMNLLIGLSKWCRNHPNGPRNLNI